MKNMIKLTTGLVLGFVLGAGLTATYAASVFSGAGFLVGWDVLVEGDLVCSDPFIYPATHEIECN